jgi:prolyl oligopeptidase
VTLFVFCFAVFIGIRGGSNGGLLMGNMLVRRPDLFGAVCCAVPLLDMRCYHTLLAGASWMAEYGNPDVPEVSRLRYFVRYSDARCVFRTVVWSCLP